MNPADIVVVASGLALTGLLARFFFGPKKAHSAELVGNVQEVKVTVKGGYSPNLIRVRQSVSLRIVFDRQEGGECTSRVVFPDFALNRSLPAMTKTAVEFTPDERSFRLCVRHEHGSRHVDRGAGLAASKIHVGATRSSGNGCLIQRREWRATR